MAFENEHADLIHDVRLVEHHIRRQILTADEHRKHLAGLQDVGEHGEQTNTRFQALWEQSHDEDEESDAG